MVRFLRKFILMSAFGIFTLSNAHELHNADCAFDDLLIDTSFDTARVNHCIKTGNNQYTLIVKPEKIPINKSPWYAFKVSSEKKRQIIIYLHYSLHTHRYSPKVSHDGISWLLLNPKLYEVILDGKAIKLTLKVGQKPLYIAAQDLIDNTFYQQWLNKLGKLAYVETSFLGLSKQQRPIYQLTSIARNKSNKQSKEWVLIVGRQHPPEVTGALALMPFVETLLAKNSLAESFRQQFNLLVIPNLNPDGVAAGNWRFNVNGVDINRDWGVFAQPEIILVKNVLDKLYALGDSLALGLDFHSTKEDVFYTQEDDFSLKRPNFTKDWLAAIQRQLPDYKVNRKVTHNPGLPTFKTYISARYTIPAITYELGDDTNRETIRITAEIAAKEMIKTLLKANK